MYGKQFKSNELTLDLMHCFKASSVLSLTFNRLDYNMNCDATQTDYKTNTVEEIEFVSVVNRRNREDEHFLTEQQPKNS